MSRQELHVSISICHAISRMLAYQHVTPWHAYNINETSQTTHLSFRSGISLQRAFFFPRKFHVFLIILVHQLHENQKIIYKYFLMYKNYSLKNCVKSSGLILEQKLGMHLFAVHAKRQWSMSGNNERGSSMHAGQRQSVKCLLNFAIMPRRRA